MIIQSQEKELLTLLRSLPKDKVNEVKDFALFLKNKYHPNTNQCTDEDFRKSILEDRELLAKFQEAEKLSTEDKVVIIALLDAFLAKKQIQAIVSR